MSDIWEYGGAADDPGGIGSPGASTPADGSGAGEGPPDDPAPGRVATAAPDAALPWPPPRDGAVLAAFGETWRSATFDPARFFARIPRVGGTGAAVLYYLALGMMVAGATLFWEALGRYAAAGTGGTLASELGLTAVEPITSFLLSPLLLLAALGLSAGVVHVLLLIFDGARHGLGTTVRVFCYAYSPMILGVVPVVGAIAGTVWMLVLAIIGLREAHQADGWKPLLAILLPFIMVVGLFVLVVITILAAGAALLGA